MQTRLDQGEEPEGQFSREDRERRFRAALDDDRAPIDHRMDPRTFPISLAKAKIAEEYADDPDRLEELKARAIELAERSFEEVPWDRDLESVEETDLVNDPTKDAETERRLEIAQQFFADQYLADSPRRVLRQYRDELPSLRKLADCLAELILASKADTGQTAKSFGKVADIRRGAVSLRDLLSSFDEHHAEGLAAELIGYGLAAALDLEQTQSKSTGFTQAHYAGGAWRRIEQYREREKIPTTLPEEEKHQLQAAASLFLTITLRELDLLELKLVRDRSTTKGKKAQRTRLEFTKEGNKALRSIPGLTDIMQRARKVPLFTRPRPLHQDTVGTWTNPYQPMARKLFDEHETGNPERTSLPELYRIALERFQNQAYTLDTFNPYEGTPFEGFTETTRDGWTSIYQVGQWVLGDEGQAGTAKKQKQVWKKGDGGFITEELYEKKKLERLEKLKASRRYNDVPDDWIKAITKKPEGKPDDEDVTAFAERLWKEKLEKEITQENWWNEKHRASERVLGSLDQPMILGEASLEESTAWRPRWFFPVYVDYRGRFYYRPVFSPQGDTFAKGMVAFHDVKPVTLAGRDAIFRMLGGLHSNKDVSRWLGPPQDKASKTAQVTWAKQPQVLEALALCGEVPTAIREGDDQPIWAKTDSPFEFLAGCQALSRLARGLVNERPAPEGLPVRIDAVCSGVQHLATLARDKRLGKYVNLTKDKPDRDLYELIAKEGEVRLRNQAKQPLKDYLDYIKTLDDYQEGDEVERKEILDQAKVDHQNRKDLVEHLDDSRGGELSRGECKPVGMQYGYNVGRTTIARRLHEDHDWPQEFGWLVARAQFDVIEQEGRQVAQVMRWLQHVVRVLMVEGNLGFEWENQVTGFTLVQKHAATEEVEVDYAAPRSENEKGNDLRRTLHYRQATDGWYHELRATDPRRARALMRDMVNGISANVVHSLDSALLVLLAIRFPTTRSLTIIHDSVGTHANDVDELYTCIQKCHVELYSQDHLRDIYDQSRARLEQIEGANVDRLQRPPQPGKLNLAEVMRSDYFWS